MKRCLSILLCALLTLSLAACRGKPASVGTLGDVEYSSALYQLLRYNVQQENPQGTPEEWQGEVLEAMERYGAVYQQFDALGGEFGQEGEDYVAQYTQEIWESSEAIMSRNGITREALEAYVGYLYRLDQMPELVYGVGGIRELSEEEILDYVQENCYYGTCVYLPLRNEGIDLGQDPQELERVRGEAETIRRLIQGGQTATAAAERVLPDVLERLNRQASSGFVKSYVYPNLYTPWNWEANLSPGSIQALQEMEIGDCAVLENQADFTVFLRADPTKDYRLEDLRSYAAYYGRREELQKWLDEEGAALEHKLNESAIQDLWETELT